MLLALLAFIWLIPIVWLLVTSFSSYKGINTMHFSLKDGLWTITCSCFPAGYRCQFSGLVSEFPDYWSSDLCNFHIICADGSVCNELHAVSGT